MLTLAGVIFAAFLLFLLYQWILDPNALYGIGYSINENGLKNINSLLFMGAMYALAIIIYVGARMYRKKQGIDLDNVYKEIPVE